jgi:capsule polysaccharide export protein KpsE/RkpR
MIVDLIVVVLCTVLIILFINYKGDLIMATLKELQDKIDTLTSAEADREARDVAQDAVTQQQIAVLQQTVTDLQNQITNGTLSPENQAIVDASIVKIQATIDSLNAADPTAPIVP